MSNYSEKEIEKFRKKDIRISKSGIIQALIQSGVFTHDQITDGSILEYTAERYLKWVWDEKETSKEVKPIL